MTMNAGTILIGGVIAIATGAALGALLLAGDVGVLDQLCQYLPADG